MEYCVIIKETLSKVVNVEAESKEAAEKIVREKYWNQEITLDSDCFDDVEFETSIRL